MNSSGAQIATTTTNSSGIYGFANLAAGTYTVSFNTPAGFTPTLGKVGSNDNTDSDPIGGSVSNITLAQSQANTRVDAGFIPSILKLGDRVWYDANNDGNLNSGENGMRNITVRLYADNDNNNVADGAPIATTTTNSTGNYLFTSLAPGNYIVGVVMPAGYMSSIVNGSDPDNNIDNDDNGQLLIGNEIRGLAITLNLGAEFDGTKMNSNTNNTYDFGLLPDCNCINTSGNLLTNGSFESGTTGWTASGGSVSSGTGYIACGSKNGFNSTATSGKLSIVYQDVVTALGTTLTLNAFAGAHTAGLTCSPKLSLIFLNAAGKVLCQNDVAVTQDVDANFGQLSMYTISAKAPIGATKARVQSSTTCNTLKLDAFCLRVASNTFAKDQSSPVKSTEPLPKELNVTASPNPVVGLFNLSVSSSDKITPVNIRILNIDGKILSIKKTAANSTLKIDAAKWLSGIYIAEVIQGKQSKVIKLVKTN